VSFYAISTRSARQIFLYRPIPFSDVLVTKFFLAYRTIALMWLKIDQNYFLINPRLSIPELLIIE
jgi:hypothetical protein